MIVLLLGQIFRSLNIGERKKKYPQFQFWSQVLTIEILILMFIRSIRETNFELYRGALSELVPYFFALDHTNYARWLLVHLRDKAMIKYRHLSIAKEFKNSLFVVHKSEKRFSAIAIDQAHEQNNKIIKGNRSNGGPLRFKKRNGGRS